jgi:hypothetical protein
VLQVLILSPAFLCLQGPGRPAGPAGSLLVLEEAASELLDYLRCLDAASMAELTGSVGPEVSAAMDNFVARLMGTGDRDSLSRAGSDCTAQVGAGICAILTGHALPCEVCYSLFCGCHFVGFE